jgi:hypothetical protein
MFSKIAKAPLAAHTLRLGIAPTAEAHEPDVQKQLAHAPTKMTRQRERRPPLSHQSDYGGRAWEKETSNRHCFEKTLVNLTR